MGWWNKIHPYPLTRTSSNSQPITQTLKMTVVIVLLLQKGVVSFLTNSPPLGEETRAHIAVRLQDNRRSPWFSSHRKMQISLYEQVSARFTNTHQTGNVSSGAGAHRHAPFRGKHNPELLLSTNWLNEQRDAEQLPCSWLHQHDSRKPTDLRFVPLPCACHASRGSYNQEKIWIVATAVLPFWRKKLSVAYGGQQEEKTKSCCVAD